MNPIKKIRFIRKTYKKLINEMCPKDKAMALHLTMRYKSASIVVPMLQKNICDDCKLKLAETMHEIMEEFEGKKDE